MKGVRRAEGQKWQKSCFQAGGGVRRAHVVFIKGGGGRRPEGQNVDRQGIGMLMLEGRIQILFEVEISLYPLPLTLSKAKLLFKGPSMRQQNLLATFWSLRCLTMSPCHVHPGQKLPHIVHPLKKCIIITP